MKIRNPNTIRRAARVLSRLTRPWHHSLRFAYRPLTKYLVNDRPELLGGGRYIYAYWHEYGFVPSYVYARPDTGILVSLHADGELLSQLAGRFGFHVIRGSSTRGGTAGLLRMLRDSSVVRHFGLTPDGPKGPHRKCQFGTVYLASRTGMPVVPVGFGYARCWRANNWDRYAVPYPLSRVRCVTSHPIPVPPKLKHEELEPYQRLVEDALDQVTLVAERWAATGEFDPLGYEPPPGIEVRPEHQKAWPAVRLSGRAGNASGTGR